MEADIEFVAPAHKEMLAYANNGNNVYAYVFDYVPQVHFCLETLKTLVLIIPGASYRAGCLRCVRLLRPTRQSQHRAQGAVQRFDFCKQKNHIKASAVAFHGLDHGYIFTRGYSSNFNITPYTERDKKMADVMCILISNFVKTG